MKLFLKNIGKIGKATVQMNGVTVIAGKNDTGKSTINKAIFSVLNGFHRSESLHTSAEDVLQSVLERELNAAFRGQLQNIYSDGDGKIELKLDGKIASVCLRNGRISEIERPIGKWRANVFYNLRAWNPALLLQSDNAENYKQSERIYAIIAKICGGEIAATNDNMELGSRTEKSGGAVALKNLSPSLESFLILKTLLQNNLMGKDSILLLDEPESHLHPERQLLYAELLILLHKELGVRVLLNTHSYYFLDAIEVYSQKYDMADKCLFYLASVNGDFATMTDVTGNTEVIYQEFARPLQLLENERYCILPFAV